MRNRGVGGISRLHCYLEVIFMSIKEIRGITGLSQEKFGQLYNIPRRTIQDWELENRTPPAYVLSLLERVVKIDFSADSALAE